MRLENNITTTGEMPTNAGALTYSTQGIGTSRCYWTMTKYDNELASSVSSLEKIRECYENENSQCETERVH